MLVARRTSQTGTQSGTGQTSRTSPTIPAAPADPHARRGRTGRTTHVTRDGRPPPPDRTTPTAHEPPRPPHPRSPRRRPTTPDPPQRTHRITGAHSPAPAHLDHAPARGTTSRTAPRLNLPCACRIFSSFPALHDMLCMAPPRVCPDGRSGASPTTAASSDSPRNARLVGNGRRRTDLGAELNRSRHGVRPISVRNRTDLGTEFDRSRCGTGPISGLLRCPPGRSPSSRGRRGR